MVSLHLIPFLLILASGSFAAKPDACEAVKSSVKSLKDQLDILCKKDECLCDDAVDELPFTTKTYDLNWWTKQKVALQNQVGSGSLIQIKPMEPSKLKENCSWNIQCVVTDTFELRPHRTTIVMGFFGKRKPYNATFPADQIEWPEISCGKDKKWTYRGYSIEYVGCLNESL